MISLSFLLNNKILPGIWLQIGNSSSDFPMPPLLAVVDLGSWLLLCLAALLEGEMPADTVWEQIADELPCALYVLAFYGFDWPELDRMHSLSCVQKRWLCVQNPHWSPIRKPFEKEDVVISPGLKMNCLPVSMWPCVHSDCALPADCLPCKRVWQIVCF